MTACKLLSHVMPVSPYYAMGSRAITICKTHDWTFDGVVTPVCPIGRIEAATTAALRAIDAATDNAIASVKPD